MKYIKLKKLDVMQTAQKRRIDEPFSLIYYSTQTFRPMRVKFVHVTSITFVIVMY